MISFRQLSQFRVLGKWKLLTEALRSDFRKNDRNQGMFECALHFLSKLINEGAGDMPKEGFKGVKNGKDGKGSKLGYGVGAGCKGNKHGKGKEGKLSKWQVERLVDTIGSNMLPNSIQECQAFGEAMLRLYASGSSCFSPSRPGKRR